jgi:cytochrome c5
MNLRWIAIFLILFAVSACSSTNASQTAEPPPSSASSPTSTTSIEGATLVQQRCTVCHSITRVESAHHSASQWQSIVDSMIRRGAQLTPEEETVVVNYLAATYGP